MIELLKQLFKRWINGDDKNAQNNFAHGNEQNIYRTNDGAIQHIYNDKVYIMASSDNRTKAVKTELSKIAQNGKLTAQQIKVIEHLISTVNAMRIVGGEPVSQKYLPEKLAEISSVNNWQEMPQIYYDRAIKYLMKCCGFVPEIK